MKEFVGVLLYTFTLHETAAVFLTSVLRQFPFKDNMSNSTINSSSLM